MPIIPSVFQPIKANDYQQRPFKAYKRYRIKSAGFTTDGGYFRHEALYRKNTPHILADTGAGVSGDNIYLVNSEDNTNQHVVWNTIDHRYYRNNNPAQAADFLDIESQERNIWHSASIFTSPYGQVGEKIKHGTYEVTSSKGTSTFTLYDDTIGNLRDPLINSSSFASSSRNFFYMSFNNLYQEYNDFDDINNFAAYSGSGITYSLNSVKKKCSAPNGIRLSPGVYVTGSGAYQHVPSGISARLEDGSYIRIPHDNKFDRFGKCDDWTISLWHAPKKDTNTFHNELISKYGITEEQYIDKIDLKRKVRDVITDRVTSYELTKTPFIITADRTSTKNSTYHFYASDGGKQLHISSSAHYTIKESGWNHVAIRNKNQITEVFINGSVIGSTSGSIPEGITANYSELMVGNVNGITTGSNSGAVNDDLAEIRMYDYAVDNTGLNSLSNRNYTSGSLYQTNVAGNVFYKNAQVVVSSPMPKYHTGSGVFNNDSFEVAYRGVHMIYENECLVRVPKDQFNVTMNPTSTYRPATVGEVCTTNQSNVPPGEMRKGLFVSGTLKPYITSIGLYDDKCRMIATAKLAQPIQKNPDVDMNFVVRWDY